MIPRTSSLLPLLAAAALCASGAGAQDASRDTWIGREAGIAKPTLTYLGSVPVVGPDARLPAEGLAPSSADVAEGARRRAALRGERKAGAPAGSGFVAVDAATGRVYQLEASAAELARLHQLMEELGATAASDAAEKIASGGDDPVEVIDKTWSDGQSTIVRRGIEDGFPANHDTFRRIGQIGSGCSGSLVGKRHVLTVAHCAVDNITMKVFQSSFRPRRDGSADPMNPVSPWGSRSFMTYVFPQEYWNGTCNFLDPRDCNKFDIALGILNSDFTNVPFMGFGPFSLADMNSFIKQMRGYPRCVNDDDDDGDFEPDAEAPVPCDLSTLYGDTSPCQIRRIGSPDSDGWNRELWVDCDGTRGMSGSAMYSTGAPLGLTALGTYSQAECTATGCVSHPLGDFPNVMTRITPQYAAMISAGKAMFSCPSGPCN